MRTRTVSSGLITTHAFSSLAVTCAAAPEVNAWVVVKPDDTCVIRIARAEMGQGTHTGLAQLVAEELDIPITEPADDTESPTDPESEPE